MYAASHLETGRHLGWTPTYLVQRAAVACNADSETFRGRTSAAAGLLVGGAHPIVRRPFTQHPRARRSPCFPSRAPHTDAAAAVAAAGGSNLETFVAGGGVVRPRFDFARLAESATRLDPGDDDEDGKRTSERSSAAHKTDARLGSAVSSSSPPTPPSTSAAASLNWNPAIDGRPLRQSDVVRQRLVDVEVAQHLSHLALLAEHARLVKIDFNKILILIISYFVLNFSSRA